MIISQLLTTIFLILMICITILSILLIKENKQNENYANNFKKDKQKKRRLGIANYESTISSKETLKKHYYMENEKSVNRNRNTHNYYDNESNTSSKQPMNGNFYNAPLKKKDLDKYDGMLENSTIYSGIYDDSIVYCGKNDTKNGNDFLFYGLEDDGETLTNKLPINYINNNSSNNNISMDVGELTYDESEKKFTFKNQNSIQTLPKPQKSERTGYTQNNTNTTVEKKLKIDKHTIKIGDTIIFFYNNERYSSVVLDIKHDNLKVIYRSNAKWINLTDVKKIL